MQKPVLKKFLAGEFTQVCDEFENNKSLRAEAGLFPYWIGALVFTGELEKALALFEKTKPTAAGTIACRFYLSIGHIRQSRYREARTLLARNLRAQKKHSAEFNDFYIYQGIAFYRFFCGRFGLAEKHASRAYQSAVSAHFTFGEMISKDLLAHSLVQLGQVQKGLRYFEDTLKSANRVKNMWLMAATRISMLKARAQHGLHPEDDLKNLETALGELAPQDTYSIAELLLEMVRQHLIRGQFSKAESYLARASDLIYKHQNRRQIALLNLRMSYMLYLQAQYSQALHVIRFAEQNIDANIDLTLWTQMSGLKEVILQSLGREDEASLVRRDLLHLAHKHQAAIPRRIFARGHNMEANVAEGQDRIGDLLDKIQKQDPRAPLLLIENGYYGLLHKFYRLPFGTRAMIFDLIPGSLVILDRGNVTFKGKGLNSLTRKILLLLRSGPQSKETLVESIWGYTYDPLRHDALIYSSINKARKILGANGDWIALSEDGYHIKNEVRVIFKNALKNEPVKMSAITTGLVPASAKSPQARRPALPDNFKDLNFRQLQVLDYLRKNPSISIHELSTKLTISKPTATRDLSHLHKLGILQRVGKGRATRYLI